MAASVVDSSHNLSGGDALIERRAPRRCTCARAGRCAPAPATAEWDGLREPERAAWSAYCNGYRADRADHPANCLDWAEAAAFCAWARKRLPSEEEWEWAARNGPRGTTYPWGNDLPRHRPCWNGEGNEAGIARRTGTCPVGSHPGADGASGVKDLAGGVWEWTSSGAVVFADSRGRGGSPARIARGGGWADVDPAYLAAGVRVKHVPTRRSPDLGFRCARAP